MTDCIGHILMTIILHDRVILRLMNITAVYTKRSDPCVCICMSSNYIPDEEWTASHQIKLKITNQQDNYSFNTVIHYNKILVI